MTSGFHWPTQNYSMLSLAFIASSFRVTEVRELGSVVQSIVSLTTSLRCQLVKYILTTLSNTLLFFVEKM